MARICLLYMSPCLYAKIFRAFICSVVHSYMKQTSEPRHLSVQDVYKCVLLLCTVGSFVVNTHEIIYYTYPQIVIDNALPLIT